MKRFSNFHQCAVAARLALLMMLALVLAGCAEEFSWRQKLVLVVETPDGERRGESVGVVRWRDATGASEMGMGQLGFRGEAVVVGLSEGRYLFALIKGRQVMGQYTLLDKAMLGKSLPERAQALQVVGLKGRVPPERYPKLVTFEDITRPETVRQVDPNDLAATFGEGYALKSITLEITDEPVTMGRVEKVLGWLGPYPEPTLGKSEDIYSPIFAATVNHGDFIRRQK